MPDIETFLAATAVDTTNKKYIVGPFGSGVTVYKQQMRAINLIYALHESGRIRRGGKPIVIVGGGIAGLTASVAALALGYEVYLFERMSVLCHLQRGCETRWLHPHSYDWPLAGSESSYAGLPFLNWKTGTAANVVEQITGEFNRIINTKIGKTNLKIFKRANINIDGKTVGWNGSILNDASGSIEAQAIIGCVGFGVEMGVEGKLTASYWRNDSVHQYIIDSSQNDHKTRFLVSGIGDGGLIDVLRVRIKNFNQNRLIEEFFPVDQNDLKKGLIKIVETWKEIIEKDGELPNDNWLDNEFSLLRREKKLKNCFLKIDKALKERLRNDTIVILNGKRKQKDIFSPDRASLLNSFLVFLLMKVDRTFRYEQGECKVEVGSGTQPIKISINDKERDDIDICILRHGTDRNAVLTAAGFEDAAKLLARKDAVRIAIETSSRLWEAGWWEKNAVDKSSKENIVPRVATEFVPPATVTIATTFVTTLSDIIKPYSKKPFRLTLHRLIKVRDEEFFQQIARYAGTKQNPDAGRVGRVWSAEIGIAGLASRLGKPIIINHSSDFKKIWEELHMFSEKVFTPRPMDPDVRSLLGCPFFSPEANNEKKHVSLMLFMDSDDERFFDDPTILRIVFGACEGFVKNLENMKEYGEVLFFYSDYNGFQVRDKPQDYTMLEKYASIDSKNKIFGNFREGLTFKSIESFDSKLRD